MLHQKKKIKKNFKVLIIYIKSTFNNTIITITDLIGNVIYSDSAGKNGFKGSKKSTPFASQIVTKNIISKLIEFGVKKIQISLKGKGVGKESALRIFKISSFEIISIKDDTSISFNGCRQPKRRRI